MAQNQALVLVVDDESSTRWAMCRYLNRCGFATEEAADGRNALEKVSLREYDVIITDLRMPRLDGMEFINAVKDRYYGRIIVVTAHGTAETYFKTLDFGAYEYIHKPIDVDNLVALIGEIIAGRAEGTV